MKLLQFHSIYFYVKIVFVGTSKGTNRLYERTNNNIETAFKKIMHLMFGAIMSLSSVPGILMSYYNYYAGGNGESSFKLTFLSM